MRNSRHKTPPRARQVVTLKRKLARAKSERRRVKVLLLWVWR